MASFSGPSRREGNHAISQARGRKPGFSAPSAGAPPMLRAASSITGSIFQGDGGRRLRSGTTWRPAPDTILLPNRASVDRTYRDFEVKGVLDPRDQAPDVFLARTR